MKRMPKWMGDAIENLLASKFPTVNVTRVEYLSPEVKKVWFEGDLTNIDFAIGYAVSFRVSAIEYRDYTPVVFDSINGRCEIIFHIHGHGPGSAFADGLQVGDTIKMIIPRGRKLYQKGSDLHFFFGDESSLGTCESLMQTGRCTGVLELDEVNWGVPEKLGIHAEVISKHGGDAGAILDKQLGSDKTTYVLTGKGSSIQAFRKLLRERGVSSSQIITKAYWVAGKKGI